jgi:hypothetical protein
MDLEMVVSSGIDISSACSMDSSSGGSSWTPV